MMTSKPALRTAAARAAGAKCGPRGSEMGGKSKQSFMIKVKIRIQESEVRIKSYKCFLSINISNGSAFVIDCCTAAMKSTGNVKSLWKTWL